MHSRLRRPLFWLVLSRPTANRFKISNRSPVVDLRYQFLISKARYLSGLMNCCTLSKTLGQAWRTKTSQGLDETTTYIMLHNFCYLYSTYSIIIQAGRYAIVLLTSPNCLVSFSNSSKVIPIQSMLDEPWGISKAMLQ